MMFPIIQHIYINFIFTLVCFLYLFKKYNYMMHRFLSIIVLTGMINQLTAQELYIPRNVKIAYEKGTRSKDGKPGLNYWQNFGKYKIDVSVHPPSRTVNGTEEIVYFNNSNDTIRNPIIKLILNIHKPGAARNGDASETYLTSGVHIDELLINGSAYNWTEPQGHLTWQALKLPKPLLPKDSMQLSFKWHYDASIESGREGMLDSTTFFLSYFYPRVAVFDDYKGWDRMTFTDAQEFYNDFNNYQLTVHAPKNFIVWATGTLQNTNEVLTTDYAAKLNQSFTSDDIIHIATAKDLSTKNITAQNDMNAWKWVADNITDVTVAISDHYNWDASSVIVDKNTNRRASVQAAYRDNAKDYHYMVQFGQHALDWLSNNWPGVPYPFPKTTIVLGQADMEYPMMVNDNSFPDTTFSRFVVEHEIAHTWFPFYMGINEHRYGFMDEAWATTFEYLIGSADMGKKKATEFYKQFRVNGWINDASDEEDLPIITPGNILSGPGLGNNEYGKASIGYLAMKDLLGDELFKKCLHGYMDRWHGKHPMPWDFFYSFNDISGRNLNWFWNSWFFSNGYIDLAVGEPKVNSKGYEIPLSNIGGFPAPVDVMITYTDHTTDTLHQTPAIWEKNMKEAMITVKTKKKISSIEIDGGIFVDADRKNNVWKAQ